jgi:hypothetical protein
MIPTLFRGTRLISNDIPLYIFALDYNIASYTHLSINLIHQALPGAFTHLASLAHNRNTVSVP